MFVRCCPQCGRRLYENTDQCTECGVVLEWHTYRARPGRWGKLAAMIILLMIFAGLAAMLISRAPHAAKLEGSGQRFGVGGGTHVTTAGSAVPFTTHRSSAMQRSVGLTLLRPPAHRG